MCRKSGVVLYSESRLLNVNIYIHNFLVINAFHLTNAVWFYAASLSPSEMVCSCFRVLRASVFVCSLLCCGAWACVCGTLLHTLTVPYVSWQLIAVTVYGLSSTHFMQTLRIHDLSRGYLPAVCTDSRASWMFLSSRDCFNYHDFQIKGLSL